MRWERDVAAGAVAVVIVTYVWWLGSQRRPSPVEELHDLYASPVCLSAAGTPRGGSPSVAQAWARTAHVPIARAHPLFHGHESIELQDQQKGVTVPIAFIRTGAHAWRPAQNAVTTAWVARACRSH